MENICILSFYTQNLTRYFYKKLTILGVESVSRSGVKTILKAKNADGMLILFVCSFIFIYLFILVVWLYILSDLSTEKCF